MQIAKALANSVTGSKAGAATGATGMVILARTGDAQLEELPGAAVMGGALGAALGFVLGGGGTLLKEAAINWCSRR